MMGDFASPAAVPTGGGICINNSNVNLNSAINATGSSTGGIPKHSTVVERLRQRIEGCRRHHVNCEGRYHQAHAEQLELDRRETLNLYQRSLEQRAKKSGNSKQQSKQQEPDSTASAEQRSSTLIAVSSALHYNVSVRDGSFTRVSSPVFGTNAAVCLGCSANLRSASVFLHWKTLNLGTYYSIHEHTSTRFADYS